MSTTSLARMTDAEFAADLAERAARVDAGAAEIIARLHRPNGFHSRRRSETIVMLLVTVPARETTFAYWVSTDGDDATAVAVPKSVLNVIEREADGLFLLATMKAWVAIDRHMAQATIPGLTKSVKWTDDQRLGWKRLQQRIKGVRRNLDDDARRAKGLRVRRTFAIRRGDTA